MMFHFSIQEHAMPFHFFIQSFVAFKSILKFSSYKSCISCYAHAYEFYFYYYCKTEIVPIVPSNFLLM